MDWNKIPVLKVTVAASSWGGETATLLTLHLFHLFHNPALMQTKPQYVDGVKGIKDSWPQLSLSRFGSPSIGLRVKLVMNGRSINKAGREVVDGPWLSIVDWVKGFKWSFFSWWSRRLLDCVLQSKELERAKWSSPQWPTRSWSYSLAESYKNVLCDLNDFDSCLFA